MTTSTLQADEPATETEQTLAAPEQRSGNGATAKRKPPPKRRPTTQKFVTARVGDGAANLPPFPLPTVPSPAPEAPHRVTTNPPERQASLVKRAVVPATMATALGLDGEIGPAGYRLFLDGLMRDAGDPTDPVEVMLLEQLALCHLRSMQLQGQAGGAKGLEAIELYNAAAARLTAEFRKTALALKEYRSK